MNSDQKRVLRQAISQLRNDNCDSTADEIERLFFADENPPNFFRVYKYDGDRGEVEIDTIHGESYEMAKITASLRHGSDAYIK